MRHREATSLDVGDLPPQQILHDAPEDAPAVLAAVTSHLADAVSGLQVLAEILGNELPSLRVPEQSQSTKSALRVHHTPMESPTTKTPKYLSLAEVATVLNLDSRSLRRLRRDPTAKFPASRQFGRAVRWKAAEIDAWAERQRSKS